MQDLLYVRFIGDKPVNWNGSCTGHWCANYVIMIYTGTIGADLLWPGIDECRCFAGLLCDYALCNRYLGTGESGYNCRCRLSCKVPFLFRPPPYLGEPKGWQRYDNGFIRFTHLGYRWLNALVKYFSTRSLLHCQKYAMAFHTSVFDTIWHLPLSSTADNLR